MSVVESIHHASTLINQFMATGDDEEAGTRFSTELAGLLAEDQVSLLKFIQALGSTLTSEDSVIRRKGIHCLSSTLENLDSSKLNRQDVNVLVDFLIAKLDDNDSTMFILQALRSLVQYKAFTPGLNDNIDKILQSLEAKYDRKRHLAKVRYEAFKLLNTSLELYTTFLVSNRESSDKFIEAFIHVASGEKDPRNLLQSFELNTKINKVFEFDIENEKHKEYLAELFDVCFCYFPISFTPPPNDPYKINADDLKEKLTETIASQSLYARDSFSSLKEKLTSTNPVIRNDVLKTMYACVQNYSSDCLLEYWDTIWDALKYEILHNDISIFNVQSNFFVPPDILSNVEYSDENNIIRFTSAIIQELSARLSENHDYEKILGQITSELKTSVSTITDKSFKQSVLIACLTCAKSEFAFNYIVKFIFAYDVWGKFFNVERDPADQDTENQEVDINEDISLNVSKQRDLVDSIGYLFISYQSLSSGVASKEFLENNSLFQFKDHILMFLGQLLQSSSNLEKTLKCNVIQQLIKMIQLSNFLTPQESLLIFNYFKGLIEDIISFEKEWERDLVLKEINAGLVAIMNEGGDTNTVTVKAENVSLVVEHILPVFLNLMPVEDSDLLDVSNLDKLLNVFDRLCVNYQFLEVLSIRLLNKIVYLNNSDSIDPVKKVVVFTNIVNLLLNGIYKTELSKQFLMNSWHQNFLPRFFVSFLQLFNESQDEDMIELSGKLFGIVIKFTDKSKHQELLGRYTDEFTGKASSEKIQFPSILEHPSLTVFLYNNILANVDKTVKFENGFEVVLIEKVVNIINSIDPSDDYLRLGYLQNLALLVNKFVVGKDHLEYVYEIMDKLRAAFNHSAGSDMTEQQIKAFEMHIWITKGLVMRLDQRGVKFAEDLIDFVKVPDLQVRNLISKSLNLLFIDIYLFVNSTPKLKKFISNVNGLNVRLLYKQNLLERILPKLIHEYVSSRDEIFLVLTSLVLSNLSTQIIKPHLGEIFPLVLNSLSLKNTKILEASLSTLNIVINEDTQLITPHLHSLVSRLQGLVVHPVVYKNKIVNTEEIRLLGLNCLLNIFTKVDTIEVIKYKTQSINVLKKSLDDKKRNVRKLCSDVLQVLHELGR